MLKFLYRYDTSLGSYRIDEAPAGRLDHRAGYWVRARVEFDLVVPATLMP